MRSVDPQTFARMPCFTGLTGLVPNTGISAMARVRRGAECRSARVGWWLQRAGSNNRGLRVKRAWHSAPCDPVLRVNADARLLQRRLPWLGLIVAEAPGRVGLAHDAVRRPSTFHLLARRADAAGDMCLSAGARSEYAGRGHGGAERATRRGRARICEQRFRGGSVSDTTETRKKCTGHLGSKHLRFSGWATRAVHGKYRAGARAGASAPSSAL